jgi:2,4-dienoyl-CoA reductase-like NADH-dependent reductase (Old Yellow Enzyme family)
MSKLQRIFEPIRIGRVTIPNRVVRTAHGTWIARGHVNEDLIAYHVARAKGGVGCSYIEYTSVHPSSFSLGPWSWDDSCIPGCRKLVEAVHQYEYVGAAVFLASPESSYVVGQTLNVDGGLNLS